MNKYPWDKYHVDTSWPFGVLADQYVDRVQYIDNFCPGILAHSITLLSFHTAFTRHEIVISIVLKPSVLFNHGLKCFHLLALEGVTSVVGCVKFVPIPFENSITHLHG